MPQTPESQFGSSNPWADRDAAHAEPTPPGTVSLAFTRFAAGTGSTRVHIGIPLRPGQLFPGGAKRIEIGGTTIDAVFQEGAWRHADGSIAVVRAQCQRTLTQGVPESATFVLGQTASPGRLDWVVPAFPVVTGITYQTATILGGVGLPTSAEHMCLSRIFGPLIPIADVPVRPAFLNGVQQILYDHFPRYYAAWVGDNPWPQGFPGGGSQYDRPYLCLQMFARTGLIKWMDYALRTYALKRELYDRPNRWELNEAQGEIRSTVLIDALFGETAECWHATAASRYGWTADAYSSLVCMTIPWATLLRMQNDIIPRAPVGLDPEVGTSCRAIARNFERLSALILSGHGNLVVADGKTAAQKLVSILGRWVHATLHSGALGTPSGLRNMIRRAPAPASYIDPVQNFQQGITIAALHDILTWHPALLGPELTRMVTQRVVDLTAYLWSEFWDRRSPPVATLYYTNKSGIHGGREDPNIDSCGYYANAFYWMYAHGYGSEWRERGDLMMMALAGTPRDGNHGPAQDLVGPVATYENKHLNQVFEVVQRGSALRQGVV